MGGGVPTDGQLGTKQERTTSIHAPKERVHLIFKEKRNAQIFKMHFYLPLQETKADKEIGWRGKGEQQSCI